MSTMEMPERIWVSQMEAETLTRPWPDKAPIVHEYIPASRLSALAERVERAEALLKECEDMLEEYADLGLLETKEVVLMHRISPFLHDGTKGEGE